MGREMIDRFENQTGCIAGSRGKSLENNIYFDQCMDFLARMIEKYGDRIEFPDQEEPETPKSIKETISELQSKSEKEAKQALAGQQQKKPKKKRDQGLDR